MAGWLKTYQLPRNPYETTDPFAWPKSDLAAVPPAPAQSPFAPPGVVVPPLPPEPSQALKIVARPPQVDRFPIVIGQNLTGQYLSSAYRLGTSGWRYQFVDLINELLEHDPHARAVCRQRVLSTAGGRIEILPARLPKNHKDIDLAQKIAEEWEWQMLSIPALTQAIGQLNWGVVYGLSGAEIEWERTSEGWEVVGLSNIHSRRLNYPDPTSWDLHIYDQGLVGPGYYMGPTTGYFGLRVGDLPGKFIAHAPALNADYPTRDGEGRYIGMYMLLKRMVVRASAQDFERTIRPWVVGYFNRIAHEDGERLPEQKSMAFATPEDIAALDQALNALGTGSLNSSRLPNSVRLELLRAASAMNAAEFLAFLNREISKCLLGQAFTTEPGANGNLSTSEMAKEGTLEIVRYDAACLSDTLERDLIRPWFRLNYPGLNRKLCPRMAIRVDELPDPAKIMEIAAKGASIDMPISLDKLAEQTGMPILGADDTTGRRTRMVAAGKAESPPPEGQELDDETSDTSSDDSNATPPAPKKKAAAKKTTKKAKAKSKPAAAET